MSERKDSKRWYAEDGAWVRELDAALREKPRGPYGTLDDEPDYRAIDDTDGVPSGGW